MYCETLNLLEKEMEKEQRELKENLARTQMSFRLFSIIMEYQVKEVIDRKEYALH